MAVRNTLTFDIATLDKYVLQKFAIDPNSGCWLWEGHVSPGGYGSVRLRLGKGKWATFNVHKITYQAYKGIVPEGLFLDHLCRTRSCGNPNHLEAVTPSVNGLRGVIGHINKQRASERTHCINGHEYTEENTYMKKATQKSSGGRQCRECKKTWGIRPPQK